MFRAGESQVCERFILGARGAVPDLTGSFQLQVELRPNSEPGKEEYFSNGSHMTRVPGTEGSRTS